MKCGTPATQEGVVALYLSTGTDLGTGHNVFVAPIGT